MTKGGATMMRTTRQWGLLWITALTFVAGLLLTMSQGYIAVAVTLPDGLPGARLASTADKGELIVTSSPQPAQFFDLTPGDSAHWRVDAGLEGAPSGKFSLRVTGDGALVNHPHHGLLISVDSCSRPYVGGTALSCAGKADSVVAKQLLAGVSSDPAVAVSPDTWVLPDIRATQQRHLLVTLTVPSAGADDESLMGLRGTFGVGLYASGDAVAEVPSPDEPEVVTALPDTGGPALALLLLAVGSTGLGALMLQRKRRGEVL